MSDAGEVTFSPIRRPVLWSLVGLGAAGAAVAVVRTAYWGAFVDPWSFGGLLVALMGLMCLYGVTARVSADAYGVHSRTLLRRWSAPWYDVADVGIYARRGRYGDIPRASVMLRDGRARRLPLPSPGYSSGDGRDFDAKLSALRALHRRYGKPDASHLPVISARAAGHGPAGRLGLCALLLTGAGVAAWFVPVAASEYQAWQAAAPCTAATPAAERGECLSKLPAVIAGTKVVTGKGTSYLYFTGGRPLDRLAVSADAADEFHSGDHVTLTVWRHEVRVVTGEGHAWHDHFPAAGDVADLAALLVLGAGYFGSLVALRGRGRRRGLRDDEVLPSAGPFVGALVGTALWLLPLCHVYPTTLTTSPVAVTWGATGLAATLGLFVWAWRATRIRPPGEAAATGHRGEPAGTADGRDVFVAARFLDPTDYNPNAFGTHIVFGDGPPAVIPHAGPGRFAAKEIPVQRLTAKGVRRLRGDDGDTVPRSWHVAELDDAGKPVRLAAAPANLVRIMRELGLDATRTPMR